MNKKFFNVIGFLLLICVFASGCYGTFSQKQEFESISVEAATSVDAAIRLKLGDLFIAPGSQKELMNARFDYLQPTRRPEIKYSETSEKGLLSLQQASRSSVGEFSNPGDRNKWNLILKESFPLNLDIHVDRGLSFLNLGALNSRRINIECGQGDVFLSLLGKRAKELRITIEGGEGLLELKLPTDVGVRILLDNIAQEVAWESFEEQEGYLVNAAFDSKAAFIDLSISGHKGAIQVVNMSSEQES